MGLGADRVQKLLPGGDFENGQADLNYWLVQGFWSVDEKNGRHWVESLYCDPDCVLAQNVDVPAGNPTLSFSLSNISFTTYCGYYKLEVYVQLFSRVFAEDVCDANFHHFEPYSLDLQQWAGTRNVSIAFVFRDSTPPDDRYGNIELDDIFLEFDALIFQDSFEGANQ